MLKLKKLFAVLLSILVLASVFVVPALAEDEPDDSVIEVDGIQLLTPEQADEMGLDEDGHDHDHDHEAEADVSAVESADSGVSVLDIIGYVVAVILPVAAIVFVVVSIKGKKNK